MTGDQMDARERRLAQNEAFFREVNERIDELADQQHQHSDARSEYLCECANADCTFRIGLSAPEYEAVRADGSQFVVLPGHYTPEVEALVSEGDRFWIVTKTGEAGDFVEAANPRSR